MNAQAELVPELTGTAPNTTFSKEYVQMVGRFAYFWAWPMVNSFNRRTVTASVPEPGLRGGILPNAPLGYVCMLTDYISADQRFVTCSNQDVAYGFGFAALDESPVVIGARFWRPLLGLRRLGRARRLLRRARQAIRDQTRLLYVGRSGLERKDPQWGEWRISIFDRTCGLLPTRLPGRYR